MEHGIAVDTVIARVCATCGIYPALVVRLLTKEIVEIEGNNE
jgi:hypothetical protein